MLAEKLKRIVEQAQQPRSQVDPVQLVADMAQFLADVQKADDVAPEVFAAMPTDMRKAAMQLWLAMMLQAVSE